MAAAQSLTELTGRESMSILLETLLEFACACPVDHSRFVARIDGQYVIPQADGGIQLLVAIQHDGALVIADHELLAQGRRFRSAGLQTWIDEQRFVEAGQRLLLVALAEQGHAFLLQPFGLRCRDFTGEESSGSAVVSFSSAPCVTLAPRADAAGIVELLAAVSGRRTVAPLRSTEGLAESL